jgi:pimeloyl-ACP methyl ester carboxylesterase
MEALDLPHLDKGPHTAAPPVILLHGFPLDHTHWAPQVQALEAAGVRVIAPDLRGLGKAPLGKGPATMALHAADIIRLADRLGLRRFSLAGFSMGGYVALELARVGGDRLAGLALVDTRAEPDSPEAAKGRVETAAKVRTIGMQVMVDAMLPKLLTKDAPPALVDQVRRVILAQRPEGCAQCLLGMAERIDQRPHLSRIRVPTVVVVGAEDAITPPEAARVLAEGISGAHLVTVANAAHLTTLERPDAVNAAMVDWARKLS